MANYLLLRNNKESGPYSLEALVQMGLKPYDLVWVEGRSAAWRYPSEIEDLKAYAPAVEEQPFDRFFKKPAEQQEIQAEKKVVQMATAHESIVNSTIGSYAKPVFVAMPAKKQVANVIKKEEPAPPTYKQLATEFAVNTFEENNKYSGFASDKDTAVSPSLETKYAQSLDDITEHYVQTLVDRKRKLAQKKQILSVAQKALPFAAVLLIGIVLGMFVLNRNSRNNDLINQGSVKNARLQLPVNMAAEDAVSQQQTTGNQPAVPATAQTATPGQAAEQPSSPKQDVANQSGVKKPVSKSANLKTNSPVAKTHNNTSGSTLVTKPASSGVDAQTGERMKMIRSPMEEGKVAGEPSTTGKNNSLLQQVSVKANDYKRGTFGGIHDLQLTVQNNSPYLLDQVSVELQYLKPSEQPLKSELVQFTSVPPTGSLTLTIPPSNRGIKVAYKITKIESKQFGNEVAGKQ
ncbi:MAG TPA: hypothetical protein VFS36_05720 [Chitinophagaceae bacterium]|nr:hypothetical protein [Chitinophagaceae bacterium]